MKEIQSCFFEFGLSKVKVTVLKVTCSQWKNKTLISGCQGDNEFEPVTLAHDIF